MVKFKLPAVGGLAKKKKRIKIGLDWGFSSFKVVVLESEDDTYILKDARIIELSSKNVDLRSLFKDLGLYAGVNLGICGPNVVVRYVSIAKMSETEFRKALRYEAASHLPFPIEQMNLDGAILKVMPDNKMLAMLAAARKDFVNQRLKIFQEAGIQVNILDIDSLALINAFNYVNPKDSSDTQPQAQDSGESKKQVEATSQAGAVVLLNIGASVTNINILEDNIPHFTRDINIAGKHFSNGESQDTGIANFVTEIRKSFDYYEAGSTAIINKIFLSGGGSLTPDLPAKLEGLLGIPIKQWDPFRNFLFLSEVDKANIVKNSAQYAVAVGLALR